MELLITVTIPKGLVREMNVYRRKYHPSKLSRAPAHITLVPPFTLRGTMENLMKDLEGFIRPRRLFWMAIDGLGAFGNDVLFFKPDCPRELKDLRTSLKGLVGSAYRRGRGGRHEKYWGYKAYRPHVTIAVDRPEHIRNYKKELKGLRYRRRFRVTGVGLSVRRKDGRWVLKREFLFKG